MKNIIENPTVAAQTMIILALQVEKNFTALDAVIGDLLGSVEQMVNTMYANHPEITPRTCHAGCHWCCGFKTLVFPFEIVRIVHFLNQTLPSVERDHLLRRIEKINTKTADMSLKQRARLKIFCPLLHNDACLVYPVRPISCRACLSTDEKKCKQAFYYPAKDRVERCSYSLNVYGAIKNGLDLGLSACHIDNQYGELVSFLHQGFQAPNLPAVWLQGRPVFHSP